MAFFQIEYSSDVLGQYRQVDVIYPDRDQIAETESDTDIPVLYLLHGMGGNHNSWAFRTNIQRLLRKTNLIVIMPNSENGWYTNTNYGVRYYDAIAKELPQVMQRFFPSMTKKREKTFIAGLSMGGYGSFKLALTTNHFACAGSFSGALGLSAEIMTDETSESKAYWQGVFGDLAGKDIAQHKLVNLAKQHDKKTKFFAWCGLEDFLFDTQDQAVADLSVAASIVHQVHWYMRGSGFLYLHPKMDELMDSLNGHLDVISERLITIGGEPFSTLVEFSSNSGLTETTGTFDKSMTDQIQLLVDTYKYLSVLFQVGLDITDEEGDAPSNDIFTAAKSEIDKTVWMLTAELGKEPGLK